MVLKLFQPQCLDVSVKVCQRTTDMVLCRLEAVIETTPVWLNATLSWRDLVSGT